VEQHVFSLDEVLDRRLDAMVFETPMGVPVPLVPTILMILILNIPRVTFVVVQVRLSAHQYAFAHQREDLIGDERVYSFA
jgi:hypothetical protein